MRVSFRRLVTAIAMALGITASTFADESVLSSIPSEGEASRVATVYSVDDASLTMAPQQQMMEEGSGEYFDDVTYSVGDDFYTYYSRTGGLIGGAEVLFLRPYATSRIMSASDADMGFQSAYRAWIGFQNEEGIGGRLRYFEFDNAANGPLGQTSLEFQYVDAEITQQVDFRRWNLLCSGGVRQAETGYLIEEIRNGGFPVFDGGFAGVGLTFGVQATRDLNSTGTLRLAVSGRWSSLFGNGTLSPQIVGRPADDELVNILELTFGPQYQRELGNGALLTLYAGLETQTWFGGINDANDDIGLAGFSSGISILR